MKMGMTGIWKNMLGIYAKKDLSEEKIAECIICKTAKIIERNDKLDECDEK